MTIRCLHCNNLTGTDHRRGLCRHCYRDEAVRSKYFGRPRGCWLPGAKAWTVQEDATLMEMFEDGCSDKQMAEELGRPLPGVTKRRQRLGLAVDPTRRGANMVVKRFLARLLNQENEE